MLAKLTNRNTVPEIKKWLGLAVKYKAVRTNADVVADAKAISERLKGGEKVKKQELLDLATKMYGVIEAAAEQKPEAEKPVKPEKESSLKKKPDRKKKAEQEVEQKPEVEKPAEKPKKETKKPASKKQEAKSPKEEKPKGFSFPESFEDEDGVLYTKADDIKGIDELRDAVSNDEEIVIASHWTPAMLKQDGAYGLGQLPKKLIPKRFINDLDLLSVIFVGEQTDNILSVSMYTEAMYYWKAASLKQTKSGRKGFNLEFEIYRATEEAES